MFSRIYGIPLERGVYFGIQIYVLPERECSLYSSKRLLGDRQQLSLPYRLNSRSGRRNSVLPRKVAALFPYLKSK